MDPSLSLKTVSAEGLQSLLERTCADAFLLARLHFEVFAQEDSCQFGPEFWITLSHRVRLAQLQGYDGILILHGTDTLAYSSAAMSFLTAAIKIPVVFTGAQKPLSVPRSDARLNFISSVEVLTTLPKSFKNRTLVVFGSQVFLGTRVRKRSAQDFDAFESPRFPALAEIGTELRWNKGIMLPKKNLKTVTRDPSLPAPRILHLHLAPGSITPETFRVKHISGIVLNLYGSGTAPTKNQLFMKTLRAWDRERIPVIGVTERYGPDLGVYRYESMKELHLKFFFEGKDLTPECAYVKLWLSLIGKDLPPFDRCWTDETSEKNKL